MYKGAVVFLAYTMGPFVGWNLPYTKAPDIIGPSLWTGAHWAAVNQAGRRNTQESIHPAGAAPVVADVVSVTLARRDQGSPFASSPSPSPHPQPQPRLCLSRWRRRRPG
jgi:hypothetical protein